MKKRTMMLGGGLVTGIAATMAVNPLAQSLGASPLASASPVALTASSTGAESAKTTSAASTAATATAATPSAGSAGASSSTTRTITGSAVSMRYGTVQVSVTAQGGTITAVQVLQAPGGRNQQFTDYAVPILTQEVLSAQRANVAIVSGATYVSEAFISSVASALQQL